MVDWSRVNTGWTSIGGGLAAELELMIGRGELPRGEKIPPERELAAALGVSRTTLREAMLELEIRGLVSRRPGRGTVVLESGSGDQESRLSAALGEAQRDFTEVMEMRRAIEPGIVALAATKANDMDIELLEELIAAAEAETSAARLLDLDVKFHIQVADLAKNSLLSELMRTVSNAAASSRRLGFQGSGRKSASLSGHRAIIEALRTGDSKAAESAMAQHLHHIEDLISPSGSDGHTSAGGQVSGH
jgi:GntR family transcriptional regulator, transcriptional repressor for pyruvate dehydrogenase complex